jgi:hypothetical protein
MRRIPLLLGVWGGVFFLLLLVIIVVATRQNRSDSDNEQSAPTLSAPTQSSHPTPVKDEPGLWMAKRVDEMYRENSVFADSVLKGKTIRVWGLVKKVAEDLRKRPYLALTDKKRTLEIHCYFRDRQELADLKPGDDVTIEGICIGIDPGIDVGMKNCSVFDKQPNQEK